MLNTVPRTRYDTVEMADHVGSLPFSRIIEGNNIGYSKRTSVDVVAAKLKEWHISLILS